ncbi:GGDEF domain-containing protein [uncultured Pseudoteredinibacter sp.]|uniref:GGDEF domain-containing protein n=1 Tax=uncultured Pseudoteredinibacter sp. TaxID=1641701 RepID=UPI002623F0F6|nr:GGDEF domain-containing protein [uncultured Pseudoteredinibacter sp.]
MKLSEGFHRYFYALQALLLGLLVYSAYLINDFYQLTHEIARVENNRFDMVALANELQQSSDQLTFFAQNYVVTGKAQYLESFQQILAIRDGITARPQDYHATYWNLNESERNSQHYGQERVALTELMNKMPYSEAEFALLNLAQNQSDKLALIEQQAFTLAPNDKEKAKALLFGERYKEAKHSIMAPIDQFLILLNKRLANTLRDLHQREESLAQSLPILLGLNTLLMAAIFVMINIRFNRHHKELVSLSMKDHLTRINNRKYLSEYGPQYLQYHRRHGNAVCLALMDIDHFKKINDNFGHQIGDHILQHFCKIVGSRTRQSDTFVRYGGEEFVLLLPNMSARQCEKFLNEICQLVAQENYIDRKHCIAYTVSIGWVDSSNHYDLETMLQRADAAMYQAKQAGRNRAQRGDCSNPKPLLAISN